MPNAPKTPHRQVRIGSPDWAEFGEIADQLGTDRSALVRQLVRWYLRRPGAVLPERPGG